MIRMIVQGLLTGWCRHQRFENNHAGNFSAILSSIDPDGIRILLAVAMAAEEGKKVSL